jgi:hypothetical protein
VAVSAASRPLHIISLEEYVRSIIKSAVLGVLISAVEIVAAGAQLAHPSVAAIAPAHPAAMLPEVFVPGNGGRATPHYAVPAGYDSNVALHPYTSGLGPCTEGAVPSQGCHQATSHPIPPSHYDRPPFTR